MIVLTKLGKVNNFYFVYRYNPENIDVLQKYLLYQVPSCVRHKSLLA